jgi:hypothetical protein
LTQAHERWKAVPQAPVGLLICETGQPAKMPPVGAAPIASKPQRKLPRGERTQKAIGKSPSVVQPCLKIVRRSLHHYSSLETRYDVNAAIDVIEKFAARQEREARRQPGKGKVVQLRLVRGAGKFSPTDCF